MATYDIAFCVLRRFSSLAVVAAAAAAANTGDGVSHQRIEPHAEPSMAQPLLCVHLLDESLLISCRDVEAQVAALEIVQRQQHTAGARMRIQDDVTFLGIEQDTHLDEQRREDARVEIAALLFHPPQSGSKLLVHSALIGTRRGQVVAREQVDGLDDRSRSVACLLDRGTLIPVDGIEHLHSRRSKRWLM